jgi:NAD(P)-dependent dehydrogenase (short-subunit alcohol dehydrogenase family)
MSTVVVITGAGATGVATARRLGAGRKLVVADVDREKLDLVAAALARDGFDVTPVEVDVSQRPSVEALVAKTESLGQLTTVVHTAGLSPTQASPTQILQVDLLGTEHILESFLKLATDGSVAVCIASIAGYLAPLSPAREHELMTAPTEQLIELLGPTDDHGFGGTCILAKRVNQLRVQHHAARSGRQGGRVVSISPGLISTPMGRQELEGEAGEMIKAQYQLSALHRFGTPEDAWRDRRVSHCATKLSRPLEQQILTRGVVVCRSGEPRRRLVGRSLGAGRRRTHPQPRLEDGTEDPLAASGERGSTGRAVRRGLRDGFRRQSSSRGQPIGGPCFRAADMPPSTRRSVPVT